MGRFNLKRDRIIENAVFTDRVSQCFDFLYKLFLNKKSFEDQTKFRRDTIILIFLLINNLLLFVLLVGSIITSYAHNYKGINPLWILGLFFFGILLHLILKLGFSNTTSLLLVAMYLLSPSYASYHWGVELPMALLGFVLAIALSGSLLSARHGLLVGTLIILIVHIMGWLQVKNIFSPLSYWKNEAVGINDVIEIATILLVIMIVLFITHYQTERLFKRNKVLEEALRQERNSLIEKVDSKVKEIETLAIIGKETAGILHDINQPLTTLKIYVENLDKAHGKEEIDEIKNMVSCIESYIKTVRNSLRKGIDNHCAFKPRETIERTLKLFRYRSIKNNIDVKTVDEDNMILYGNETMFERAIMNVISNAFDACEEKTNKKNLIEILLRKDIDCYEIIIKDTGIQIPNHLLKNFFSNSYTTKDKGSGIGSTVTKQIFKEHFNADTKIKQGENSKEFIIQIPLLSNREKGNKNTERI